MTFACIVFVYLFVELRRCFWEGDCGERYGGADGVSLRHERRIINELKCKLRTLSTMLIWMLNTLSSYKYMLDKNLLKHSKMSDTTH